MSYFLDLDAICVQQHLMVWEQIGNCEKRIQYTFRFVPVLSKVFLPFLVRLRLPFSMCKRVAQNIPVEAPWLQYGLLNRQVTGVEEGSFSCIVDVIEEDIAVPTSRI